MFSVSICAHSYVALGVTVNSKELWLLTPNLLFLIWNNYQHYNCARDCVLTNLLWSLLLLFINKILILAGQHQNKFSRIRCSKPMIIISIYLYVLFSVSINTDFSSNSGFQLFYSERYVNNFPYGKNAFRQYLFKGKMPATLNIFAINIHLLIYYSLIMKKGSFQKELQTLFSI